MSAIVHIDMGFFGLSQASLHHKPLTARGAVTAGGCHAAAKVFIAV